MMKKNLAYIFIALVLIITDSYSLNKIIIKLPEPKAKGEMSVEEALQKRRSKRQFKKRPLRIEEISQLLWAAQGITKDGFFRTTPSAGSMYGLEVYLVAGEVTGMEAGIYKYKPMTHEIELIRQGDFRYELADAALAQLFIEKAPATIILTAVYERSEKKYTDRGVMYTNIEAGHAGQNIYLQAVAMNLGTCAVGSFLVIDIKKLVNMPDNEEPICLFPVGEPEK